MPSLTEELKKQLIFYADKYETKDFLLKDPSQFMHLYDNELDQEIVAFLSANMAFGQRVQILKHIQLILNDIKSTPSQWVKNEDYRKFFTNGDRSFYRMYTHNDFIVFFDTIRKFISNEATLGTYFKNIYKKNADSLLAPLICNLFPNNCHLIPHTKETAAKRINMFLRWMTRTDSPVDLGLWSQWYPKEKLLIPMDTHVMQQSVTFNLLPKTGTGKIPAANLKNCILLTNLMKEVFPGDPCRGDYALFGLGVDTEK